MIVATAGHIDHGKTTLVRALTGMETDRLKEEKARGISIEVGFAHLPLDDGRMLSFIDVPGHERFIRNMLGGVYAVGHALLVVAADDGVMPQTREHLHILGLLGLRDGTVVITKCDRAGPDRIAQVRAEVDELLESAGFPPFPQIAVSATTGAGIGALRHRLAEVAALESPPGRPDGAWPRFVVDRVFVAAGSGTVLRGTLLAGEVRIGDSLLVSPAGIRGRVRKLQRHGQAVELVRAGERCAINLANLDHASVARGDWLVHPEADHVTDRIDVRIRVLRGEARALAHWTPLHLHIGAADIPARLALRRGGAIEAGQEALAQLRLDRPVHAAHGDRLIIRDQSASRTIGGGFVVNPFPPSRRSRRSAVLQALDGRDRQAGLLALLDGLPDGVPMDWFARIHTMPLPQALELLPQGAPLTRTRIPTAFSFMRAERLGLRAAEAVARFHAARQDASGIELSRLHKEIAPGQEAEVFADLVRQCAAGWGLELVGSQLRLAGFDSTANPQDKQSWSLIWPILEDAGFQIPSARELSVQTSIPLQKVRDLLHRKAALGEAVKITPERFALPETVETLARKAAETARRSADGLFSAADYRDVIGTGRALAIEILECLDRQGATLRQGNVRLLRAGHDATAATAAGPAHPPRIQNRRTR